VDEADPEVRIAARVLGAAIVLAFIALAAWASWPCTRGRVMAQTG
jgi:TRAP-type C4-dicarboxylate transport system permease small subunit